MARLVITCMVVLLGVSLSAAGRTTLGTSPVSKPTTANKPAAVPQKATKPASEKPGTSPKPMPRTSGKPAGGKPANATGTGARAGIGKFEYMAPLQPPIQSYPGADFGRRRLMGPSPASPTNKPQQANKPATGAKVVPTAGGKPAANKATSKPMPRTSAPGGKPANATGTGARAGIGKFEYMAPLQPPIQSYPGADFGRRRLMGPSPSSPANKPQQANKPAAGAKVVPTAGGKPAANKATPKPMPRTSAPGGKPANATGSGARSGIGKFEYMDPLQPPVQSYAGADFGH